MPAQPYANALDQVALKWRTLAERRRAHFFDLYQSGRWKHYYSQDQFLFEMRQAVAVAERWARIAPRPEPAPRPEVAARRKAG